MCQRPLASGILATQAMYQQATGDVPAEKGNVLRQPIAIAKADVQQAFDTIHFDAINDGLKQEGITPKTRIAIMTGLMNKFMMITSAKNTTRQIKRQGVCKHGGPESMDNFIFGFDNAMMETMKDRKKTKM